MKVTVLIDNIENEECVGEWGLAILVEYRGKTILLDTGTTGAFARNAEKLGIDLRDVDFGVLSHAHYDHSDGLEEFFGLNSKAKFFLRSACKENCYALKGGKMEYIGIHPGLLERFEDRIEYVDGDYELSPGIKLIGHKTPGLDKIGRKSNMFTMEDEELIPERFEHEQSLVFETSQGLAIFNSCSHGGADNIVEEVAQTYPGSHILAMIGGFHLFLTPDEDVRKLAGNLRSTGVNRIVTGHCTGSKAFAILKEELGDKVVQMHSGLTFEIED